MGNMKKQRQRLCIMSPGRLGVVDPTDYMLIRHAYVQMWCHDLFYIFLSMVLFAGSRLKTEVG